MLKEYSGGEILGNAVVRFTASWCVPCKAFQPVFDGVGAGTDVPFYAIDIEDYMDFAREHKVQSIPAVFTVERGEWTRFTGTPSAQQLAEAAAALDKPVENW